MKSITYFLLLQLENGVLQQDLNTQTIWLMLLFCVSNKCSNYSESKDNNFLVLGKGPLSLCYDYAN